MTGLQLALASGTLIGLAFALLAWRLAPVRPGPGRRPGPSLTRPRRLPPRSRPRRRTLRQARWWTGSGCGR